MLGGTRKTKQTLRQALPELTILDLSANKLRAKEVLKMLPEKGEWVAELDLRENQIRGDELGRIREKLPFLEVFNGEIITEIGYSTKCKIKELGGDWQHAPQEAPKPVESDLEDSSLSQFFEKFEGEVQQQRTKMDLGFNIYREKLSQLEREKGESELENKVEVLKSNLDAFITEGNKKIEQKMEHSKKRRENQRNEENIQRGTKNKKKREIKKEKRTRKNFLKKSRFKILRLGPKLFGGRTRERVREQNEAVRRMLMGSE